eukprot:CAMPEP_0181120154 /NCGR_PEP_ID=MMETSP1071-20121207/23997_1 /TAXON_ID=35127 /ORGANISM="Thalassiosira sp., Strain NH16" /LENGTH=252 /DNA_ID=CAMNT_0023204775 /DNA_START=101 /DNA_END=859 /DNA_ORIENTATION=+
MSEVEVAAPTPEESTTMIEVAAPAPEESTTPSEVVLEAAAPAPDDSATTESEIATIPPKAPAPHFEDTAYNLRQAKILADEHGTADKGRALKNARIAAAARGEKWTEDMPVAAPVESEARDPNDTVAPKAPGVVYGEIDDAAYKIREAKILNDKHGTANKGRALKNARIAAAQRGEAWTPDVTVPELPPDTVVPKGPGVVYGEIDDVAYKLREAKILADKHGSADKGRELKAAKVKAATKGEAWKPDVPGTD